MAEDCRRLFVAGDAMVTRPWSHVTDRQFLELVAAIRAADVSIVNLETVIHDFGHPAQADSGGTWTASPPAIAGELKWAGVDMIGHANNHTTDYGPGAVLETLEHAARAGLIVSGSGADLQSARAPRFLARDGFTVAHVAMAVAFVRYGRASRSRGDFPGRPGVNPLALRRDTMLVAPPALDPLLRIIDRLRAPLPGRLGKVSPGTRLGWTYAAGPRLELHRGKRPVEADAEGNLAAISAGAEGADLVVVSVHAHRQGEWLTAFARKAIDAGGDVILVHGPHEVRGIGIYRGKPIFYGLGDFVYEPQGIARFPQETYDKFGLPEGAGVDDVRLKLRQSALSINRETFEGAAAILHYRDRALAWIELLPIDLQFDADPPDRGRPRMADAALGRRIIARLDARSAAHGTTVTYDAARNCGVIELAPGASSTTNPVARAAN